MNNSELIRYKDILLKILAAFIKICEENNLQYFCAGGTLIGAVRHHGFIPWDDDLDFFMPRKDYDRLEEIMLDRSEYKVISIFNSNGLATFKKIYDCNTTLWEYKQIPFIYGVYLDIFPLDETVDNKQGFLKKYKTLRNLCRLYQISQMKTSLTDLIGFIKDKKRNFLVKGVLSILVSSCLKSYYRKKIITYEKELANSKKGDHLASYYGDYWDKEYLKRSWFDDYIEMPFEHLKVRACKGYDGYLSRLYGDYMKLPPIEKQVTHHYHYYLNMDKGMDINEVLNILKRKK